MHLPTRVFLLRMVDELMHVAFHRPIATGRVCIEPTARLHCQVGCLLYRLHREIAGRLDDDSPLPTDPGDNRRPVFVIMAPTGLAFLPPATRAAPQVFFPTPLGFALLASSVIEVIGFDRALHLAIGFV